MKTLSCVIKPEEQHAARLSALHAKLESLLEREATATDSLSRASLHIAIRQCRYEISIVSREERKSNA